MKHNDLNLNHYRSNDTQYINRAGRCILGLPNIKLWNPIEIISLNVHAMPYRPFVIALLNIAKYAS